MVSRFSRSSLKGLSIRRNESIPLPGERVSASFSQLLGRFRLDTGAQSSSSTPISRRNYADRPVSRPKAHTGRTKSAPRKKTVGDTGKTESTGRKSSVGKAKAKSSPKAKVKAKPKKTIKRKAKPKKTTKRKPKKVLTEEQKAGLVTTKNKSKIRELKEKALKSPPSGATTAWAVYLKEQWNEIKASTQAVTLSDVVKQATTRFRELKPEETEVRTTQQILCTREAKVDDSTTTTLQIRTRPLSIWHIANGFSLTRRKKFCEPIMPDRHCGAKVIRPPH